MVRKFAGPAAVVIAVLGCGAAIGQAPANIVIDEYARVSALKLCADEYPDDMTMRGACRRNSDKGLASFRDIAARYTGTPEMQRALTKCLKDYTKSGATDFTMAGACARNNEQGFLDYRR